MRREPARFPLAWSAAAALFVVAGLGVYYALFSGGGNISTGPGGNPPLAGKMERPTESASGTPGPEEKVLMDKGAAPVAQSGADGEEKQKSSLSSAKRSTENRAAERAGAGNQQPHRPWQGESGGGRILVGRNRGIGAAGARCARGER